MVWSHLEFRPEGQNDSLGVEFANLIESNKVIPDALGNFGFPGEHKPNFEDIKVSNFMREQKSEWDKMMEHLKAPDVLLSN